MELSNLSLNDLRDLEQRVKTAIALRRDTEIAAARQQVQALAQSLGVSVQELVGGASGKGAKAGKSSSTVAIRYRHPDDAGKTWTGRGRSPKWIKEWTDSGKSLEKLLVN